MGELFSILFFIFSIPILYHCITCYSFTKDISEYRFSCKICIIIMCITVVMGTVSFMYILWVSSVNIYSENYYPYYKHIDFFAKLSIAICVISFFAMFITLVICPNKKQIEQKLNEKLAIEKIDYLRTQIKITNSNNDLFLPNNVSRVYVCEYSHDLSTKPGFYYIWADNNNLFLRLDYNIEVDIHEDDIIEYFYIKILQISNIIFFTTQGGITNENHISGGGGGGSSMVGAITGGLVAGPTGAIIGSRKSINEITSELITHDTRQTIIQYFNEEHEKNTLLLSFQDYQTLLEIIPEKDFKIVSIINENNTIQNILNNDHSKEINQIKQLALLKDEGIISEDEFINKKTELLKRI